MEMRCEPLRNGIYVYTSSEHRFGTDAFLLARFSQWRRKDIVVDLGTGCGIIPMVMMRDDPPRRIWGVEIQKQGIDQFHLGLQKSGISTERVTPVLADLKMLWNEAPLGHCDLVTCNPPYKAAEAGIRSRHTAQMIARHEILCTIYDVCFAANRLLRYGGRLCICNRPERLADCIEAMRQNHIEPKRLQFVCKNAESAPWLFLLEGRKGGKSFMKVEAPIFVRTENGDSEEIRALYRPTDSEEEDSEELNSQKTDPEETSV